MSRALVVGDVVDDVIIRATRALRPDTDVDAAIDRRAGGSGANIACWLAAAGAEVDFVGRVNAADAERHAALLAAHGVRPHLQTTEAAPTASVVILVDGEHRTMLTDRGANRLLDAAAIPAGLLAAELVVISGYTVLAGAAGDLVARARAAGAGVAVTAASAGYLAEFGPAEFLAAIGGATILVANRDEAETLGGPERMRERIPEVVVTRGRQGATAADGAGVATYLPDPVDPVDPTGAGDAFAAGYLAARLRGASLAEALSAGGTLAARAIAAVGARPSRPRRKGD